MDTARDVNTGEFVEAEELWSMTTVNKDGYICRGCTTKVFPASYDKESNKRRPYFSLRDNKHIAPCDVDGEEKIVRRAKKERVGTPDGFPVPFPNKLVFSDERPTQDDEPNSPAGTPPTKTRGSSSAPSAEARKYHGHTIKTIRPACRTFINFPNDREYLSLTVPGVLGDTYAKVFRFLVNQKPALFKDPKHLYYAPIHWKSEPVATDTHCELTLNSGEWDAIAKRHNSLYRVRLDWSSWSQSRRDTLLREFNIARMEAIEEAKADSQIKGWLFFIGTQDASDPNIFHVDNYRCICSLAAKIIWPKK